LLAKHFAKLGQAVRMPEMASTVKPNPEELVMAFRKAAKKLGCDKSEQRFQGANASSAPSQTCWW
jgi:hypothetical protein